MTFLISYPFVTEVNDKSSEALKRRAAGETLASIARSYAVDLSMISVPSVRVRAFLAVPRKRFAAISAEMARPGAVEKLAQGSKDFGLLCQDNCRHGSEEQMFGADEQVRDGGQND